MPRYDDYDRDDFDNFDIRRRHDDFDRGPKPQSGVGITSVVMAIAAFGGYGIAMFLMLMLAIGNPQIQDDDPKAVAAVLGIIGSFCINLVGLIIGFVGCFQSDRQPLWAILGTVFNAIIFVGMITLVVIAVMMGA